MIRQNNNVTAWKNTKDRLISLISFKKFFLNEVVVLHNYTNCISDTKTMIVSLFDESEDDVFFLKEKNRIEFEISILDGIKEIKRNIIEKYIEEKWIDLPVVLLNIVKHNIFKFFDEELESLENVEKFFSFKKIKEIFILDLDREKYNKDSETYKDLCISLSEEMIKKFNLSAIVFFDENSWYESFSNLQNIYSAIKKSMERVGLPLDNLGCYQSLSLIISDRFLSEQNWSGFQSKTNASSTIFINPNDPDLNLAWIHEYTHFLDRMAIHHFYMERQYEKNISTFSHLALDCVIHNEPINNKPLQIMAETMSATIGGVCSEEFYGKINNTIQNFKLNLILDFINNTLPNPKEDWEKLTEPEQQLLIWRSKITEVINFVIWEVSDYPNAIFTISENEYLISVEGNKKINSGICVNDIVESIVGKTNKLNGEIIKEKIYPYLYENLSKKLKEIMNFHNLAIYKDHSVYEERFFLSLGNELSINYSDKQKEKADTVNFSYYDKPLEILARMAESLMVPLITKYEYRNLSDTDKNEKIILGRDERILICVVLHSMARYIGINVPNVDYDNIPCLFAESVEILTNIETKTSDDYKYVETNNIIPDEETKKNIVSIVKSIKNDFFSEEIVINKRRLV